MTPALGHLSGIYDLDKNLINEGFLDGNGSLSIGITNQTNPIALHKIATNEPLGATEFVVDKIEAKANAGVSGVKLLGSGGSVAFQASGDVLAELAVFPDPSSQSFLHTFGPIAATKFSLAPDPALTAVVLRWGADASASGSGSIALGAGIGTVDFNAGASGELFFAVIQQAERSTPTDTALENVVSNWKLPVHVRKADDLAPRSHLLSEVGGSLTAKIGATFGARIQLGAAGNSPRVSSAYREYWAKAPTWIDGKSRRHIPGQIRRRSQPRDRGGGNPRPDLQIAVERFRLCVVGFGRRHRRGPPAR
jgi:hypothetical protein